MSTKGDKTRRPGTPRKKLKDKVILEKSLQGATTTEIAKEMGMSRQQVSKILNSDETKALLDRAEDKIKRLVGDAVETLAAALQQRIDPQGMPTALKSAIAILKSVGVLKDRVDISHQFPKPTVIERADGTQVILGYEKEGKENE